MSTKSVVNIAILGALSLACTFGYGCVSDRPSRNGVYNENQYLRKAFLVRPGDATNPDNGWMLKATVTDASAPNVFGDASMFGLYPGAHSNGDLVHFVVTSDKMQMASNREISSDPSVGTQASIINAWPVTNVDLKYRINLDGEKTNYYEENQELDWSVRQWVKVNFDRNDMPDLAPLGAYYLANLQKCVGPDVSTTLVPDSFVVDEAHDYMEWSVQVTLPIVWSADCSEAYGPTGDAAARLGREFETVTLKYSLMRANGAPTYTPLVMPEKDTIQRKYGPILYNTIARDPSTGLYAANSYVTRFDPTKPIDWYFEKGFPAQYAPYFTSNTKVLNAFKDAAGNSPQPLSDGTVTIEDATNTLMTDSGAAARVVFHAYNEAMTDGTAIERKFGDVRWNMLRWIESQDEQSGAGGFAGVTGGVIDPRTGEVLSSDCVFENFAIKDYYATRIDAYLQSIGASAGAPFSQTDWPDPPTDATGAPLACASTGDVGKSVPIVPVVAKTNHNGLSTLFQKMQTYLYKPVSQYGALGPADFVFKHVDSAGNTDQDFFNAWYQYLPYIIFADPETNPFVQPEGGTANRGPAMSDSMWNMIHQEQQLHQLEGQIDHGQMPYDVSDPTTGEPSAVAFMKNYQQLTMNHRALQVANQTVPYMPGVGRPMTHADSQDSFAMISMIQRDARHCVNSGGSIHWETKDEWVTNLTTTYWTQVFWHEFGHALGLEHNFMGSMDMPNFPAPPMNNAMNADGTTRYPLYSSSVMEYNAPADRVFWTAGWGPYDQGAISFIYANSNGNAANVPQMPAAGQTAKGASGQVTPTFPWLDPHGFDQNGVEHNFLFCNERHTRYTPLCRAGDLGVTPSEIVANEIDSYEWQYQWRNFRQYRKIWSLSDYGDTPMNVVTELRRFLPLWSYDMSAAELITRFTQIGVSPPPNAPNALYYYNQLTNKFSNEMSAASQLSASFHEAIVQQSAGARPYVSVFDNFFGDVTQQGIILDKIDAIQAFTAMWPVDNYDPDQAAGSYITSYSAYAPEYATVAEDALSSMLGGGFDAFYYAKPLAVSQFTFDTHSTNYIGANAAPARLEAQDWAGGHSFTRLDDFLAYFREIAVENNFKAVIPGAYNIDCTTTIEACNYDPRIPRGYPSDTYFSDTYNRFLGPDGRRWIWAYLPDRNQWLAADQDRNIATYPSMLFYTTDIVQQRDDGNVGPAYSLALQLKYMFDFYNQSTEIK